MSNRKFKTTLVAASLLIMAGMGCKGKSAAKMEAAEVIHRNQDMLTQIIIYDVFTPPVASRIYVYSSLAAYEAVRFSKSGTKSIAEKLRGFGPMPKPEAGKKYDYTLAAT